MKEPTTPTGKRLRPAGRPPYNHYRKNLDGSQTPLRDHSLDDILAIEAEAAAAERERLRAEFTRLARAAGWSPEWHRTHMVLLADPEDTP